MAGQFDKFVKILGTASRPARYKGAPGNPDIAVPVDVNISAKADNADGGGKQSKASRPAAVPLDARPGGNNTRRRGTVSAPLPGATAPVPAINAEVDTKVDKTDEQRDIEAGEFAFNRGEQAKGSALRSLNGVTYDLNEYKASLPGKPSEAPAPYDISDFEPKKTTTSSSPAATAKPVVKEGPDKSEDPMHYNQTPTFKQVDRIKARKGGTLHGTKEVRDYEIEHPDSAASAATGKTLSSANMGGTTPYDKAGNVKPEYNDPSTIYSTTMHEHNGEVVEGGVRKAPYTKPPVAKTGNVIPPVALDTFGSQPVDRKQAAAENKRLRENRVVATRTTIVDPNVSPSRPARGKTPERQAVLAGMREERAASLASEGKTMTTVRPDIMATAKGLGATSMYNLDQDYMNSPSFLAHEAVQKATVAHALGVHHTLGTDDDHLHRYLGGKPLEAKSRLAAAYKIVDRNLRGNPEKVPGEFALLRGMVHAGSSPQQTLRAARTGKSSDVVVNGQNVTLAEGSSENRQRIADTATNITAQAEAAPKAARLGSVAGSPTAPLAGTGRVAVRRVGQNPEESKIREFSPQERRNLQTNVPTTDDSKRKVGPVEKEVDSDSGSIIDRLKKGPKLNESDN